MVAWKKDRIRNFSEEFARPYVGILVDLDGQPYDQVRFFGALVAAGIVKDVKQGDEATVDKRRRKRWDSYLGKIREFGLGFSIDEVRSGSKPGLRKLVWRASPIAREFAAGRLDHRQFMALQCMRLQLPRPTMPLQGQAKLDIARGVADTATGTHHRRAGGTGVTA